MQDISVVYVKIVKHFIIIEKVVFSSSSSSSSSSSKLLYLHDRKILQYCKSIFIVINNKTRLILL